MYDLIVIQPPPLIEAEPRVWGLAKSIAHYCPSCGEVYSRIVMGRQWQFRAGCCKTCPPGGDYTIPGSAWTSIPQVDEALPDAALRQEFDRHLEWFDKQREKYG